MTATDRDNRSTRNRRRRLRRRRAGHRPAGRPRAIGGGDRPGRGFRGNPATCCRSRASRVLIRLQGSKFFRRPMQRWYSPQPSSSRSIRRRPPRMHLANAPHSVDVSATPVDRVRHDWSAAEIEALFALPFNDLLFRAATVHRAPFRPQPGPDQPAAVDQDRQVPRGLQVLPAERALRHRA